MIYSKPNIDHCNEDKIFDKLNSLIENKNFLKNTLLHKEQYFFNNFIGEIKTCLDRESCLYVCFLIKKCNLALDELRQNNFSSAENYFAEIESLNSDEQTVSSLIVRTMTRNVLAYKAYKYGNINEVFELLINSLEIDCHLEEKGLSLMHFHKIQTLHNIARTYLNQDLSAGINISLELMKYLSGNTGDFRLGEFMLLQEKNELSPKLRKDLFLQIFNDLIFYFVKHEDSNDIYFLEIYRKTLSTIKQKENYHNLIEEWLNIVLDLNKNSGTNSITSVTRFLKLYSDKLSCLSVFLIKKLLSIYPPEIEQTKKIRSNMRSYGFSI
ncbi:MAG: hypothetical protein ABI366_03180 [Ginsengibacter sp.]